MKLLLDISRTIARARLPAPTGIDRVERAYVDWALARGAMFLGLIDGAQYLLDAQVMRALINWLDGDGQAPRRDWRAALRPNRDARLQRAQSLIRRGAMHRATRVGELLPVLRAYFPDGAAYLNVGHDNLDTSLMSVLAVAGLNRAVMIHDVIPLDHPEFARRGSPEIFRSKLDAALQADLILCNSNHTRARVEAHAPDGTPTLAVAPLGIAPVVRRVSPGNPRAVFLCLGTIEPRKNHALLLRIWQNLGAASDGIQPELHVVGRSGWNNDDVIAGLQRAETEGRGVVWTGTVGDDALSALLSGATALLFPSHAEGYGLPLAEALAAGCPVIASDLPALREVGGDVPEWLPPGDDAAWQRMIEAYAAEGSPQRAAQCWRLQAWKAPTWGEHFAIVDKQLETILVQSGPGR